MSPATRLTATLATFERDPGSVFTCSLQSKLAHYLPFPLCGLLSGGVGIRIGLISELGERASSCGRSASAAFP